ncbi:ParB/RepB/Spo0J family partition protein [Streptomyces chartreusis]|uniref:ParB/RepB/Spo0J family partition protein n=1 Tax=Streptomyces chartreusis TaxID=1969 RepID=UPI003D8B48E7
MAAVASPTTDQASDTAPVDTDEADLTAVLLDPDTIVRDECNAREHDTEPDEDLISSVKAVGVQDPVSVRPLPNGTYGAFKGWRRTQAAQLANATADAEDRPKRQIKAFVRADLVGRDAWTRFLSLIENHQREGMSPKDTLKAAELSLIGMDEVEQKAAASALGLKRGTGKRLGRAQKLDDATLRRASAGGMDLEMMATLAEVADVPNAERRLLNALGRDQSAEDGGRGHWDQELALLKAEQADRAARAQAVAALEESDIPLLPVRVSYGEKDTARPVADLTTGLGNPLTEDNHKGCPGHSARLDEEHRPVWFCADPAAYGHKARPQPKKPKTEQDEHKAEERRRVIACNRAWKAAVGPRRDFVTRLVRQRTLPEAARVFAQEVVLTVPWFYKSWTDKHENETETVARFLGVKEPQNADLTETAVQLPKARVVNALFAHVAAACEHSIREPKTWSHLNPWQARYLLLMDQLGKDDNGSYRLSEVEAQALVPHRGEDSDAAHGDA